MAAIIRESTDFILRRESSYGMASAWFVEASLIAALLATFAAGMALASDVRAPCRRVKERFEGGGGGGSGAGDLVQSVRGTSYKIDVVDAKEHDMGKCLLLDGRRQFCDPSATMFRLIKSIEAVSKRNHSARSW